MDSLADDWTHRFRESGNSSRKSFATRAAFSWRRTTSRSLPNSESTDVFVQDNHSRSAKGTLRGLHYQLRHAQAKLCRVIEGEALDVAVDIRLGSPTFGKWTSVLLSAERQNHNFHSAGIRARLRGPDRHAFNFFTSAATSTIPASEHGILWNDPDLAIAWGVASPLVSEKDAKYPTLAAMPREFLPHYPAK